MDGLPVLIGSSMTVREIVGELWNLLSVQAPGLLGKLQCAISRMA